MNKIIYKNKNTLRGVFEVDGDKSISHRGIIIGAIAEGVTEIKNFLTGDDCLATIDCFRNLGIKIELNNTTITIYGNGLKGLTQPKNILDIRNSGTTIRLVSGVLSGQDFASTLTGDSSIKKRPMDRVLIPLRAMGANIKCQNNIYPPINIVGANLKPIEYTLPIASAQVKSAILLAGLYTNGKLIVNEPIATRNHTELMLNYFGANIYKKDSQIISLPVKRLVAKKISVPGDISSAAFFIVAALICENSHITIKNVGFNPTRIGLITALKQMGANIVIKNKRLLSHEEVCDIEVKHSKLRGIDIYGKLIPCMIDEIPIFAIAALFAKGKTIIRNAEELQFKESNRIKSLVTELKKLGAKIEETNDGMIIEGGHLLYGNKLSSYNDHRIAMSLVIASLKTFGHTEIDNINCMQISFPNFFNILKRIIV